MAIVNATPAPKRPTIHGGEPAFPEGIPLIRPEVPSTRAVLGDVEKILQSGILTNGSYVRELEDRAAEYLGVRQCVAVASCTTGLMLMLRAANLSGGVVAPSFTFAATVHAIEWNGLHPVLADIDPETLTLSPDAVAAAIGVRTSAILATHLYGTPCDVEKLTAVAREHGIRLFFDAAHAFGSRHAGVCVGGFGDAEVFSLSPTKVLVASEGGIIATNDDDLADRCRIGRNYGHPGDYDCLFVGINGRMSEIHAAIALRSLETLDEQISRRNELAGVYREALASVSGLSFPQVREGDLSTYKDFTVLVDAESSGMDAASLAENLAAEGIETRRYYAPPVHAMRAYRRLVNGWVSLPHTETASSQVITLPMWSSMTESQATGVAAAIARIQSFAGQSPT
ncbi:MAG: DegT/DnrJ/EryC1/StrS family aminotransferase [Gaiellales bacterium]